jgi:uncharacterized membrane protein YidH (DUF202 family)
VPLSDDNERDPGVARERTMLAWTRTAIGFVAVGAAMLKANVPAGFVVLAMSVPIWVVDRVTARSPESWLAARRHILVTATIIVVALAALVITLTVPSRAGLTRGSGAGPQPAPLPRYDPATRSRAAAAMWTASMPAAPSSSLLVPDPGISRTARCATSRSTRPA